MSIDQFEQHSDPHAPKPASPLHIIKTPPAPVPLWHLMYRWGHASVDAAVAGAATAALLQPLGPLRALLLGLSSGLVFAAVVGLQRGYDPRRTGTCAHQFTATNRAFWIWAALHIAAFYLFAYSLPPVHLAAALVLTLLSVQGVRVLSRLMLRRGWAAGRFLRNTVIVGSYSHAQRLAALLSPERNSFGLNVLGACAEESPSAGDLPVLATPSEAHRVVEQTRADVVIVAADCMSATELRRFTWAIEPYRVDLLLAPNAEDIASTRLALRAVSGTPFVNVALGPTRAQRVLKASVDRFLGAALLLLAAVPLLALSAAVRVSSPGPALFRQTRIGIDGEPFTMFKLRTMYVDAEARRRELLEFSDGNLVLFKMHRDPRVTSLGRILRRFSLDELPQLINVVRGDMSLVGPRPPLHEEVNNYSADAFRRLRVKPGLTGLWQVNGRSDLEWDEAVRLDLSYVDNWSMRMDLNILKRTINAVVGGRGAY